MSQTVVITGANRGIGLAFAQLYKAQGANVIALCRQSSMLLDALNVNVICNVDVATETGLELMVMALKDVPIDLLINNAGILRDETLQDFNNQTIIEQYFVNALAPLNVCQRLQSNLHQQSKIAFITSRMGSISDNGSGGRYGYRMSKAALNAGAVSLSKDLASQGIPVGIYHPGYVKTDMVNNNGDISAELAATRIARLITQLSMKNTGVFYHSNGEILPW